MTRPCKRRLVSGWMESGVVVRDTVHRKQTRYEAFQLSGTVEYRNACLEDLGESR